MSNPHARQDDLKVGVGYLRRSTDRQEQSLEDQRQAVETYADLEGFRIVNWFVDDAISGTSTEARKAFRTLIEAAQKPDCPFRYVLVYDVKRFGRVDTDEAGHYRYLLRQAGVEVVYTSEGFNGGDSDDLIRSVKQWQARAESKDLSKVTIRGQVSLVDKGYWGGGVPPFGYDLLYEDAAGRPIRRVRFAVDGGKEEFDAEGTLVRVHPRGTRLARPKTDRPRLVLSDPGRVALIQRIFQMYVADRLGYRSIANRLNIEAIPSPRDGHWSSATGAAWGIGTIRGILINGTYTGDTYWNRRSFAKFHRISGKHAHERPRHRADKPDWNPQTDWIVVKATHPAIVSHEMYQEVLRRPWNSRSRNEKVVELRPTAKRSDFVLSGLLRCTCGHAFSGQVVTKAKRKSSGEPVRTAYYLCGRYSQKGRNQCVRCAIPKEEMETRVWKMVESRLDAVTGHALKRDCSTGLSTAPRHRALTDPQKTEGPVPDRYTRIRLHGTSDQQKNLLRELISRIVVFPQESRAVVSWQTRQGY